METKKRGRKGGGDYFGSYSGRKAGKGFIEILYLKNGGGNKDE
jgi:hypothetical protein